MSWGHHVLVSLCCVLRRDIMDAQWMDCQKRFLGRGLVNEEHRICALNASLQALAHDPALREVLRWGGSQLVSGCALLVS